ncbi:hypothetical protein [Bauldia litoralis]|uniref:hypothetical protein n=1 Tax=Bauldia litoralis TaxID=665467 RepID=UPI003265E9BE
MKTITIGNTWRPPRDDIIAVTELVEDALRAEGRVISDMGIAYAAAASPVAAAIS